MASNPCFLVDYQICYTKWKKLTPVRFFLHLACLFWMDDVTANRHWAAFDGGPAGVGGAAPAPSVVATAAQAAAPTAVARFVMATPAKDLLHVVTIFDTRFASTFSQHLFSLLFLSFWSFWLLQSTQCCCCCCCQYIQYVFCDGVRPKHYRRETLTPNNKPGRKTKSILSLFHFSVKYSMLWKFRPIFFLNEAQSNQDKSSRCMKVTRTFHIPVWIYPFSIECRV